jgi:hypothetical protein
MAEESRDETLPPIVAPSRGIARRRTLFAGKIAHRNGSAIDCTIRDLSETGARIAVKAASDIPPRHCYLLHSRSDVAYEAEITWARPPQYGLRVVRTLPLDDALPEELGFLRSITF